MTENEIRIDASPTKDFFIHMLTRDIELIPAIGDLVDNCVDGALRLRPRRDFDGLFVRISVTPDVLVIEDNCGGIPLEVAKKHAFRFGRPDEMEDTPHSIGQFGVGMKRALFKLGRHFRVISSSGHDRFEVAVDVEEWRNHHDWKLTLSEPTNPVTDSEGGTRIMVEELHESVAVSFRRDTFIRRLADSLGAQHQQSISDGLLVTLNGKPIGSRAIQLLSSNDLTPAVDLLRLYEDSENPVLVRIYVGLAQTSSPQDAGWYIFCNGRLVLGADKSETTGWGAAGEKVFPRYHNRYARFRGYVFFDCDDSSLLPWTTTKTGVETENAVWLKSLQRMVEIGRPVMSFLRQLEDEVEQAPEEGTELEPLLDASTPKTLDQLTTSEFQYVRPKPKPRPKSDPTQSIQYRRPQAQIESAKKVLGAASASEVGQRSFDYFYKRECQE